MSSLLVFHPTVHRRPRLTSKLEVVGLLLFNGLLDDADEVLELVDVEQHDLDALEAIK